MNERVTQDTITPIIGSIYGLVPQDAPIEATILGLKLRDQAQAHFGLVYMDDAVRSYLELRQLAGFTPSDRSNPDTSSTLSITAEVTVETAKDMMKKLMGGALVSFALAFRERFAVLWNEGVAITEEGFVNGKGYLTLDRIGITPEAYLSLTETYLAQINTISEWYIHQDKAVYMENIYQILRSYLDRVGPESLS